MASSKRRPSKDKRYRQNKAEREARSARSAHAGEATAIAAGAREPVRAPKVASPAGESGTGGGDGAAKPGRVKRQSPYTIPGHRAVVLALMFTVVSAVTLLFSTQSPEVEVAADDPRVESAEEIVSENEDGTVRIVEQRKLIEDEGPVTVAIVLLLPAAIAGTALAFTKKPKRIIVWTMCMLAMFGTVLFFGIYGFLYLPSAAALAFAGFQARKAENAPRIAELKAQREARRAEGKGGSPRTRRGDVIDVDSTEDD